MDIFGWEPLVWVIRRFSLLALLAVAWVGGLYFLRFVRWENIKQLWGREVAEIEGWSAFGVAVRTQTEAVSLQTDKLLRAEEAIEAKTEEVNELRELILDHS